MRHGAGLGDPTHKVEAALAADGAYRMRWMDFENATGTPSFDTLQLNLVWKF